MTKFLIAAIALAFLVGCVRFNDDWGRKHRRHRPDAVVYGLDGHPIVVLDDDWGNGKKGHPHGAPPGHVMQDTGYNPASGKRHPTKPHGFNK